MKITITMKTGNAAFQNLDNVATALRELARQIDAGQRPSKVMDVNGNVVGTVKIIGLMS